MRGILVIFCIAVIASSAAALTVDIESKKVIQGEEFELLISSKDADTLGHILFDIVYPQDYVELRGVTAGDLMNVANAIYATNPNQFPATANKLRFGWVYGAGHTGDSSVMKVKFKLGAVKERNVKISASSLVAVKADSALTDQTITPQESIITVRFYGDPTDNGVISAFDATKVLLHTLGTETIPEENQKLADVSGKNGITPYDAALILMYVVGKINMFPVLGGNVAAPQLQPEEIGISLESPRIVQNRFSVPISIRGDGIISGDVLVKYDPKVATFTGLKKLDKISGAQVKYYDNNGELRIVFAGSESLAQETPMIELEFEKRLMDAEQIQVSVERALFNDVLVNALPSRAIEFSPTKTVLLQNYPNPFNPETWIPFQLASEGNVVLRIYGINGQLIRELDLGYCKSGYYTSKSRAAHWDGRNEFGERIASGVYFYQLTSGKFTDTRKMIILK